VTAGRPGDASVDDAAEALLDARTRAVAAPIAVASEGGERGLALVVAGERYAVAARAVRTVAELRRFTPLPHAPAHVAGLAAWGGVVVPVFHLRVLLGLSLAALPEYGRVVFVGEGGDAIGLIVDAVLDGGPLGAPGDERALASAHAPRPFVRALTAAGVPLLDVDALRASDLTTVNIAAPAAGRAAGDEDPR
jgi:hypothetical protein